ncbi:unnamed protein product, partial [Mesorhabditis spiculigera]
MLTPAKKLYGFPVFVGSCIISGITIAFVLWDEHRNRDRRQASVRERLKTITDQQQTNMEEYALQKQKYDEYKQAHS